MGDAPSLIPTEPVLTAWHNGKDPLKKYELTVMVWQFPPVQRQRASTITRPLFHLRTPKEPPEMAPKSSTVAHSGKRKAYSGDKDKTSGGGQHKKAKISAPKKPLPVEDEEMASDSSSEPFSDEEEGGVKLMLNPRENASKGYTGANGSAPKNGPENRTSAVCILPWFLLTPCSANI